LKQVALCFLLSLLFCFFLYPRQKQRPVERALNHDEILSHERPVVTIGIELPSDHLANKEVTAQPTRELPGGWGQMLGDGTFATYYLIEK